MEMKDLNKSQLILLALLISFVTSIATGIASVTLMQQMPQPVAQTINRIVQKTIETVVPDTKQKVQTVIIKEEDLVVDAISKNQTALFSVTTESIDADGKPVEISAGHAFAVSSDGILVADAGNVPSKGIYFVKNGSGKFKAEFMATDKNGFSFLKLGDSLDPKDKVSFTVPVFGDLEKMKIGQKIIILGNNITSGIFTSIKDITPNRSSLGSPIINLDGEIIAMAISGIDLPTVSSIANVLDALKTLTALSATEVPKTP